MEPLEAAYTIAIVLGFVCLVLGVYAYELHFRVTLWRDAYANEAQRHAATRDALDRCRMGRLP